MANVEATRHGFDPTAFRYAVMEWIVTLRPNLFVTLAFNWDTPTATAERQLRNFHARVDHALLGRNWQKRVQERSAYVAFIENADTNLHIHIAMRVEPGHAQQATDCVDRLWKGLVPSGGADARRVWDGWGLASYITKQLTPERADRLLFSDPLLTANGQS